LSKNEAKNAYEILNYLKNPTTEGLSEMLPIHELIDGFVRFFLFVARSAKLTVAIIIYHVSRKKILVSYPRSKKKSNSIITCGNLGHHEMQRVKTKANI
jgi:TRAP-type uncharacterized transport system fused permease subunit